MRPLPGFGGGEGKLEAMRSIRTARQHPAHEGADCRSLAEQALGMTPTSPAARYVELPLGSLAAASVEAVWRYEPMAAGRQRELPDGRMDLLAHCTVRADGKIGSVWLVIAGPADRPVLVDIRPGSVVLGVRFHIGWGGACLGVHALVTRAKAGPAHGRALEAIERMKAQARTGDERRDAWSASSSRTLRRDVAAVAGLPLRTLAGILRFQRAMALLDAGAASLTEVALAAGYADQAHMTRAFRRFGGFTPASPEPAPLVRLATPPH